MGRSAAALAGELCASDDTDTVLWDARYRPMLDAEVRLPAPLAPHAHAKDPCASACARGLQEKKREE